MTDSLIGSVLEGKFEIRDTLGSGAMGDVYLAWHRFMKMEIAIKVLKPELMQHGVVTERFRREAEAVSRVESPHVIRMFDFGRTHDGLLYAAMERVVGSTLRERMEEPVALDEAIRIGCEIADAISAAHAQGVIHRDLKPDNVMLCRDKGDLVKVLDFGIAKMTHVDTDSSADVDPRLTQTGMIMGTPYYMCPESAVGDRVGPAADVYSLGVTFYELISGRPPFTGNTTLEVLTQHLSALPTPPSVYAPAPIPKKLDALVLRMLEKKPEERPTSDDVVASLREILSDPGPVSELRSSDELAIDTLPEDFPRFASLRSSAKPWAPFAIVFCLLAAATLTVFAMTQSDSPDPLPSGPSVSAPQSAALGTDDPSVQEGPAGDESATEATALPTRAPSDESPDQDLELDSDAAEAAPPRAGQDATSSPRQTRPSARRRRTPMMRTRARSAEAPAQPPSTQPTPMSTPTSTPPVQMSPRFGNTRPWR